MIKSGLEVFLESQRDLVGSLRVGLIVNPSSINSRFEHAADLFYREKSINLTALFGPQHGIRGETQDDMIEWQSFRDSRTGLPAYSLYGETRQPTEAMLKDVDVLVFDVQDVGTRVYTFNYTMALAMEAARDHKKKFIVLDRPNPITGSQIEGNILDPAFKSFVGMYPIPMRHGMTTGELALLFNQQFRIGCDLEVVRMDGWHRDMWFDETQLPWVLPSPNIPTLDTAVVYPGAVMFEGTSVSEGRGTTRPFEIIGAPFIDSYDLVDDLKGQKLEGVVLRPIYFQPTFHKFSGQLCGGIQIHVTDRGAFNPFKTAVAIIAAIQSRYPGEFRWKQPPYEYVYDKLPFDVICGGSLLREQIEADQSIDSIEQSWRAGLEEFDNIRSRYLIYP